MLVFFVFLLLSPLYLCCHEGAKYKHGSFYKECTNGRITRIGCFADWLWGEAAYVPFGRTVDHLLHDDMGYRFDCRSNGRSHSFQKSACLYRDETGEIREFPIGEYATIRSSNGRFYRFHCQP